MTEEVKADDTVASDASAPAAPETAATSADPMDELLAEWDRANPPQPEVQPQPSESTDDGLAALDEMQQAIDWEQREQAWQSQLSQSQDQLRLLQAQAASTNVQNEQQINQLRGTVNQLQNSIRQAEWQQHQQRSQQDFQRLVSDEQAKLPADADERFAETFLLAEAQRDPQLAKAWEGQYFQGYNPLERAELELAIFQHGQQLMAKVALTANPQQRALAEKHVQFEMQQLYAKTFIEPERYRSECKKYVEKALDKMHTTANRPRIDRDQMADRAAVAAAVRGGGRSVAPPMPDLSNLSDRELQKYTRENFGF